VSNEPDSTPLLPERYRFLETIEQIPSMIELLQATKYQVSATWPVIRDYAIAVGKRLSELGQDADASLQRGRVITACMAARGMLETSGTFVDFVEKVIKLRDSLDKDKLRLTVKRHFFASREFQQHLGGKSPHVADGLRCLDKQSTGTLKIYDILCEAVHPNWSGTAGLSLLGDETSPVYQRLAFATYASDGAAKLFVAAAREVISGPLQPDKMKGW
jgi:hypothetical protein